MQMCKKWAERVLVTNVFLLPLTVKFFGEYSSIVHPISIILLSYVQNLVMLSQAVTKEFDYNVMAIPCIRALIAFAQLNKIVNLSIITPLCPIRDSQSRQSAFFVTVSSIFIKRFLQVLTVWVLLTRPLLSELLIWAGYVFRGLPA